MDCIFLFSLSGGIGGVLIAGVVGDAFCRGFIMENAGQLLRYFHVCVGAQVPVGAKRGLYFFMSQPVL